MANARQWHWQPQMYGQELRRELFNEAFTSHYKSSIEA